MDHTVHSEKSYTVALDLQVLYSDFIRRFFLCTLAVEFESKDIKGIMCILI